MPFRYTPTGAASTAQLPARTAAWICHRFFHASSRALRLESNISSNNHYETLNVHPTASPAEIKKSFYVLSKRHHPDHNPSDPHAPTRFMRISEAYAVLGHADKRARYDREHARLFNSHYHHHQRGSSYHSTTGPAGGRPASGLSSRRRGTFQGPPPSFYRSGGWGAHAAKRRAAHEESTGAGFGTNSRGGAHPEHPPPPPPPPPPGGAFSGGRGGFGTGGMGPGQDPFGRRDDVPHFDREAHERAQRRVDDIRAHRIAKERGVDIDHFEKQTTMSFFGVAAILAVVVMGPFLISGMLNRGNGSSPAKSGEKEREKAGGSRDKEGKGK
ncbi:hypothetical protein C7999DRAFT_27778 [Corynascus novoguineensis]|uniref:J domain-containing protein n=1 Tax=Corynascus novoguineensis TaxID=1126955 RepID=A0AAN7HIT0_9PEZI|nr:hypothetical protein C7999DRAFT_27778 [Corynascus novoguineensis]